MHLMSYYTLPKEIYEIIESYFELLQLKNFSSINKSTRIRLFGLFKKRKFEKSIFAKPFYPQKLLEKTYEDENKEFFNTNTDIHIGNNKIGYYYLNYFSGSYWCVQCYCSDYWIKEFSDFLLTYNEKTYNTNIHSRIKEIRNIIDPHINFICKTICWNYEGRKDYVNLPRMLTDFWTVWKLLHYVD